MIQLSYRDAKPICEQIKDGIRKLIITGNLQEGEQLPSVRDMAVKYAINPSTISRAYAELEQEGYLYTDEEKQSRVAHVRRDEALRMELLCNSFDEAARELMPLSVTAEELAERIRLLEWKQESMEREYDTNS